MDGPISGHFFVSEEPILRWLKIFFISTYVFIVFSSLKKVSTILKVILILSSLFTLWENFPTFHAHDFWREFFFFKWNMKQAVILEINNSFVLSCNPNWNLSPIGADGKKSGIANWADRRPTISIYLRVHKFWNSSNDALSSSTESGPSFRGFHTGVFTIVPRPLSHE